MKLNILFILNLDDVTNVLDHNFAIVDNKTKSAIYGTFNMDILAYELNALLTHQHLG